MLARFKRAASRCAKPEAERHTKNNGRVARARNAIAGHIAEVSPVRERRRGLPPANGATTIT